MWLPQASFSVISCQIIYPGCWVAGLIEIATNSVQHCFQTLFIQPNNFCFVSLLILGLLLALFVSNDFVWVVWVGGWMCGCYDQKCCPASPKLLLGLDLGLGCDNFLQQFYSSLVNCKILFPIAIKRVLRFAQFICSLFNHEQTLFVRHKS